MSIELGILTGMILIAAAATVLWWRRAARKLAALLDTAPMPGEDGCPCPYCTSRREGARDE